MSTNAVVPINQQVASQRQEAISLESFAMQLAANPNFDAEKANSIMAMLERREVQQRKDKFFEALARVQAKAPRITKYGLMDRGAGKGQIPFAKREDIDAVMRPIYQAEGFSVTWDAPRTESLIRVIGRFTAFGHTEQREWSCSPDTSGGKQNPQAAGSTVSYGQRYISIMFWDVVTEGEDVNGADPKTVTAISQNQADDIRIALQDIKADVARFRKVFGVERIEDLKQSQLDEVWKQINQKKAASK